MKITQLCSLVVLLISIVIADVPLDGDWMFNIGDDSSWARIDLNDSAWYSITVPGSWESQGFVDYDGIAWYRVHFNLDSSYLANDTLFLHLGKIGNTARPFINGVALADTITVFDSSEIAYHKIPAPLVRSENLLAIKIENKSGSGGIIRGPVLISTSRPQKKVLAAEHKAHRSWYDLPFSNGISAASYNVKNRDFANFTPHIFMQFNGSERTNIVASSARTILFKNRREIALTEMETVSSGYINGTGIIHHKLRNKDCVLDQYAFSPFTSNSAFWVFFTVLSGDSISDYALNFEINDLAQGMNIGKWSFQENNRKWLFVVCNYDKTLNPKSYNVIRKYKNEHPGFSALLKEIGWWKNWQQTTIIPQNISDAERFVYLQSLAILKMAQSREKFPSRGQIVHTFPPDQMAVATVPGMGFSIDAFLKSGHFEEALATLQFILNGNSGSLKHYSWSGENRGLGQNYTVSVNYYHGNGTEATDTGEFGPIVQLGNFGILLGNLKQYIETTDDIRFLEYYWPKISSEIADVIINNIDATGLVRADNGFYNPGAPKHYFYTSAAAYRGLVDAVWLARMVSDEARAQQYEQAAVELRNSLELSIVTDNGAVKSYLEGGETNLDAATALGLLWVFTPQDISSKETLAAFEKHLKFNNGFIRFPPDGSRVGDEWVVGDMIIADLNQYMTNFKKATALKYRVSSQAFYNYGLIPEYFSNASSDYTGTVPLCGLGAGIYVSSFWGE
ncbi:MAG: hypothetical protein Q7J65_05605 [Candidatus Marinimicrobia bacterium]|nr:hypothetical protein [Candidatus Neomarinimicrobiota bacterium]